jgi:2-hydroxychromene-2-carboxylate isomerase
VEPKRRRNVRASLGCRDRQEALATAAAETNFGVTMSAANIIEFWFEFASTYSYPAAMRIEELAKSRGCIVKWRSFFLGAIFQKQGWKDSPFNIYPVKGRYMWRDLERLCAALGLPFRRPSRFPRNSLLAARVACLSEEKPWVSAFARAVYTANFAEDLDIAEPTVLFNCLAGLVDDPAAVLAAARGAEAKARLRANTERAVELGIFGAPTFVVGEELFWGNDRLETALAWRVASED